jgi:RNA polymerase primary sigma factor
MSYNKKSGPCYSNVSLIKKALFQSNVGKLPFPDIVLYLKLNWNNSGSLAPEKLVEIALNAPKTFFQEDENGLWEVKRQVDSNLDFVISYVQKLHRPFKIKDIYRKLNIQYESHILEQKLASDIRFTQIQETSYWMLSEWELMNDLVYEFMQNSKIKFVKIDEIKTAVMYEYDLEDEKTIFSPELDKRFTVNGKYITIELEMQEEVTSTIDVPEEIKEEIARKSVEIIRYLTSLGNEVKIQDLILSVFRIKANDGKFPVYVEAVELFLLGFSDFSCIGKGRWIFNQAAAEIDIENVLGIKYAVYGSVPVIENENELLKYETQLKELAPFTDIQMKVGQTEHSDDGQNEDQAGYHTLSYYERVKGYFRVPSQLIQHLAEKKQCIGAISAEVEGFEYEWWWSHQNDGYYFYGDGVIDFFSDQLLEVGQKIKIQFLGKDKVQVALLGLDDRYAVEQNRYLDIGRLVDESKAINKSIFTLMCEVLATYPSGMHWTVLLDKVNELRTTTKSTIYNLLSKNDCFEAVTDKKGYWRLNIRKLSRYYVDENDQEIAREFAINAFTQDVINQPTAYTSTNHGDEAVSIDDTEERRLPDEKTQLQSYWNPYDFNKEYEVQPLWNIFSKWAEEQPNFRFVPNLEKENHNNVLVEQITRSYSKLLVRSSRSRSTYSVDRMDLIQEGFFAILSALRTYKHAKGRSFAHHIRRWVAGRLSVHLVNTKTLIRLPVHLVEKIHKYERLHTNSLMLENRKPLINELKMESISKKIPLYALLRNNDYISFEQYWLNEQFNHWKIAEYLDDKTQQVYYKEKSKKCLQRELEELMNAVETDSKEFSDDSFEELVLRRNLKEKLNDLVNTLPERERSIIRLRFGLDNDIQWTLEELSKKFGKSRQRILQIEVKVLKKLKSLAIKKELQIYLQDDALDFRIKKSEANVQSDNDLLELDEDFNNLEDNVKDIYESLEKSMEDQVASLFESESNREYVNNKTINDIEEHFKEDPLSLNGGIEVTSHQDEVRQDNFAGDKGETLGDAALLRLSQRTPKQKARIL